MGCENSFFCQNNKQRVFTETLTKVGMTEHYGSQNGSLVWNYKNQTQKAEQIQAYKPGLCFLRYWYLKQF